MEFEVKDTGEVQKVVMVDGLKPELLASPKTGDNSYLILWMLLMGLALGGLCITGFLLVRKRRRW